MQLQSRILGKGPAIVILHGLFGMADNWLAIGKDLAAAGWQVHLLDQRNHGRSPWLASHRYPELAEDVHSYLLAHGLADVQLIGHSMGGKAAMNMALLYPEQCASLTVVDIAPMDYRPLRDTFHCDLIDTLLAVDLASHQDRHTIRQELTEKLADERLVKFLAKNIARSPGNAATFYWRCNLPVLKKFCLHLQIGLEELELYAPSPVPALFIRGGESPYYRDGYDRQRTLFYPNSRLVTIPEAGHWLHSERPRELLAELTPFLLEQRPPTVLHKS